ncbi:MAG: hypothetical protein IKJ01_05030 [Lachnospiraceae bacterium]|nr:hypothetical protein [Lachnospiraceae bacterium]
MTNTEDILHKIIKGLQELNKNDIMYLSDREEYIMKRANEKNFTLLTVISISDNPTLNLEVAQPSKYKIIKSMFGTGILCYRENAYNILNKKLSKDEKIIKIKIKIPQEEILDLTSSKQKEYLREVYATINNKDKIKTDADFIDYVCKKGKKKFSMIVGITGLVNKMTDLFRCKHRWLPQQFHLSYMKQLIKYLYRDMRLSDDIFKKKENELFKILNSDNRITISDIIKDICNECNLNKYFAQLLKLKNVYAKYTCADVYVKYRDLFTDGNKKLG